MIKKFIIGTICILGFLSSTAQAMKKLEKPTLNGFGQQDVSVDWSGIPKLDLNNRGPGYSV
jgi:hypothetical protein